MRMIKKQLNWKSTFLYTVILLGTILVTELIIIYGEYLNDPYKTSESLPVVPKSFDITGWKTYQDPDGDFSIMIPGTWV